MSPGSPPAAAPRGRVRPRVGYLGPEGTFSEEALLASAAPGSVEPVPAGTIYDAILALRRGEVEFSIVPIENSLDGSVSVTLDLLADERGGLRIVADVQLSVRHSLIATGEVELGEIDTVITHPQVPGQCERFLRGELAHAQVLASSSTAEAVRSILAGGRRNEAALGTVLAGEIYGGTVVREGVQDRDDNETRFVWLTGADGSPAWPPLQEEGGQGEWKTSLVFWGPGADSPGWLMRCLNEFASRAINLTKIESRPKRERMGHYMFFVDLQGSVEDPRIAQAVAGLGEICEEARVLGSYRTSGPPAGGGGGQPPAVHSGASDG
jgi:prephenate dehydratase